MKSINFKTALLLIPFLWFSAPALAQEKPAEGVAVVVAEVDKGPEDALNRGTPRGSIIGYLEASAELDFEKAAQYLDLRNLPSTPSRACYCPKSHCAHLLFPYQNLPLTQFS